MAEIDELKDYKGKELWVHTISNRLYGEIKSVTEHGIIIAASRIAREGDETKYERCQSQFIPWTAIQRIALS